MKPFVINLGALALVVSLAAGAGAARPEPASAQRAKSAPARLSPAELPAGRDGSAILTTPAPGRYSIRVKSPSGARIELVDMIEGPTDSAGAPGLRDGRIDALLDKGAYKIRVANAKDAERQGAAVGGALRRGRQARLRRLSPDAAKAANSAICSNGAIRSMSGRRAASRSRPRGAPLPTCGFGAQTANWSISPSSGAMSNPSPASS